jgi:hypothetical protein
LPGGLPDEPRGQCKGPRRARVTSGQASDQANWWARPVPATTTDRSEVGPRQSGRIRRESHRVTDAERGSPPPRSTATTLTDPWRTKGACADPRPAVATSGGQEPSAGPGPALVPADICTDVRSAILNSHLNAVPTSCCHVDSLIHKARSAVHRSCGPLCRFSLFLERDSRTGHRDYGPMTWVGHPQAGGSHAQAGRPAIGDQESALWPADWHGECPDHSPIGSDEGLSTRMRRWSARLSEVVQQLLCVRPKTVRHDDSLQIG